MEENRIPENERNGAPKLHVVLLLREVLTKLWAIVMAAVIVGSCAFVGASVLYKPEYQTKTTFVVSEKNGTGSVYSNLSAAKNMAAAFSKLLGSDVMKARIAEEMGTAPASGSISAVVIEETNLLEMTVTASNPREAYLITRAVLKNYEDISSTVLGNVALDILQQPTIPTTPVNSSGAKRIAVLGASAAAVAAAALLCIAAYLRDTVKTIDEVESKLDTRLLGTVYHERKNKSLKSALKRKKKSVVITDPTMGFAFVETFKKLRTRVEYLMRRNNAKVLMVTSVMENEGKSTVAVNIALAMNRKRKSVIIIDADMKKPAIHKILEYKDSEYASISELVSGKAELRDALLMDRTHRLGLILGRGCTENSTELISSPNMRQLIEQAKKNMDMVIIDTPPLSASPDAECIAELADAAILVVRQDQTPVRVLNDAIDSINSSNAVLLGCVFNNVRTADLNENYSYGGSGKYGYHKQSYGKYGYGKYGYGKYGYGYGSRGGSASEQRRFAADGTVYDFEAETEGADNGTAE